MTSFVIKQLGGDDVGQMQMLNGVFGRCFDEHDTYSSAPAPVAYLQRFLSKPHVIVLVACEGAQIIGGLVAYELEKFEQARSEIYIYDLAVEENYRQQGVATALIDRLQEIGAAHGAWTLYVQADYVDEPAVRLYEKLGEREEVLHFDIPPKDMGET